MDVFVARQPIFDRSFHVFGYELLFRDGTANHYNAIDGTQATSRVITNSLWLIGLEHLTNNKIVFVNATEKMLKEDILTILPPVRVVLEILETVEPSEEIVAICKELKRNQFVLALDDFAFHPRYQPLIKLADIIKIDIQQTPYREQQRLLQSYAGTKIKFLAEKVETYEQYEQSVQLGYSYFQGYFFAKPVVVSARDIPVNQIANLKLLKEINQHDLDMSQISNIIHKDVSLSYKLLKFINSVTFGLRFKITSVQQALVLLGSREILKWLSLVVTREMAEEKPNELLKISVIRARFSELLAVEIKLASTAEVFTMGLFSLVDALLDRSWEQILEELPVTDEVCAALLGKDNPLHDILSLVCACEIGDWPSLSAYADKLQIPLTRVSELYLDALKWAQDNE